MKNNFDKYILYKTKYLNLKYNNIEGGDLNNIYRKNKCIVFKDEKSVKEILSDMDNSIFKNIPTEVNRIQDEYNCSNLIKLYDMIKNKIEYENTTNFPLLSHSQSGIKEINNEIYIYNNKVYKRYISNYILLDIMIYTILSKNNIIPEVHKFYLHKTNNFGTIIYLIIEMDYYYNDLKKYMTDVGVQNIDNIIKKYTRLLSFVFDLKLICYDFKSENIVLKDENDIRLIDVEFLHCFCSDSNIEHKQLFIDFNTNLIKLELGKNIGYFYDTVFEYLLNFDYALKDYNNDSKSINYTKDIISSDYTYFKTLLEENQIKNIVLNFNKILKSEVIKEEVINKKKELYLHNIFFIIYFKLSNPLRYYIYFNSSMELNIIVQNILEVKESNSNFIK